jgi:heme-degrading monooxygenase HmoA
MYLRFVKIDTKKADPRKVQDFYQQRFLPLLQRDRGCRFASLLESTSDTGACISMTLWESPDEAQRFEQSDAYQSLLQEGVRFVSETAEWSVRLSEESFIASSTSGSHVGEAYTIEAGDEGLDACDLKSQLYLRIVSARVQPRKWDDLIALYNDSVLPTLRSTRGCRAAFLLESLLDPDQALSVSFWEREEDAIRYEMSGAFEDLIRRAKVSLDDLAHWKPSVGATGSKTGPPVASYKQILGKKL